MTGRPAVVCEKAAATRCDCVFGWLSARNMRTRKVIILASLLACAVVAIRAFGPPVPLSKLVLIKKGMSEDGVREILGPPAEVCRAGDTYQLGGTNYVAGARWFYERSFTFGCVIVIFDTDGLVKSTHRDVLGGP